MKEWKVVATIVTFLVTAYWLSFYDSSFQMSYGQNTHKSIDDGPLISMNSSIVLKSNSHQYPIKYHMTVGRISGIFIERDNTTLLLNLSSASNGTLTIDLPRIVIDSKGPGNSDENFTVFRDGKYVSYNEIRTNSQSRTIAMRIDNNPSVIEIAGTQTVPEFSNIAIVILGASIACLAICRHGSNFTPKIFKRCEPPS